jgi:succinyl-diaminopimelate desuccinylase
VTRVGDNVVARTTLGRPLRLLLAGHLDTVPPSDNAAPRREADVLWGLGASDMKGGLAVMLDLARTVPEPAVDVTWCFYACEEVGRDESGLLELWSQRPDLLVADAAVLGEPTSCLVEAGCQGTMRASVRMTGVRAHTARPFTGRNAIHRLARVLTAVADWSSRRVVLDGCEYAEQLQVVSVSGGVAANVVPDEATAIINFRFAPDRSASEAQSYLQELFEPLLDQSLGDSFEVLDVAAGAPPALDHPLLASLVSATGDAPRAKVGWTDVASFWEHGVPAANFGPGDPLLAHHRDERVDRGSLERARNVLTGLLMGEREGA